MRYFLSPVRMDDFNYIYTFGTDSITATIEGVGTSDTFDFSTMPDGIAGPITTTLPHNPIIWAERVDGVLSVVLLNPIGPDALDTEKYPEWQVL